jgi:hypothetical protein
MSDTLPLSDMESTGNSAKWGKAFGQTYAGRFMGVEKRQQTDPKDGTPKFFASGDPMPVWLLTIEQPDGEQVVLWASKGNYRPAEGTGQAMMVAIGEAVKAAGLPGLTVGDELAVSFTGLGEARAGLNQPRLYTAEVRPAPPVSVPAGLFSDDT